MNKYIIYTTQGYCESPDGEEISNCQVLGKALGSDEDDAVDRLFDEQPWIQQSGYDKDCCIVYQLDNSEEI